MSTKEVIEIVKERGMKIVLKNGVPNICKSKDSKELTDKLLKVLAIHRERIIEELSKQ